MYSPISPPQTINSSSSESTTPSTPPVDLSQLPFAEAFELLSNPNSMSPTKANKWWSGDSMKEVYSLQARPWMDLVQGRCSVHSWTSPQDSDDDADRCVLYIHTTKETVQTRLSNGSSLGRRYAFSSALQCSLHRVAHHHWSLSGATLKPDTVVLQVNVANSYVIEQGVRCVNGYAVSTQFADFDVVAADAKLT
eukprot:5410088-Amphidinium_carterae.1